MIGTAVDVTDQKRAQEERERLRQLEANLAHMNRVSVMGEMSASLAHELNQPLAGVVSNGSACLRWLGADSPNLEEAREAARRIVRDGKRAGEIISRVRALASKTVTPKTKLDLNETIGEVLALVGDETKRRSVAIRTEFADASASVLGDRVQLQHVVLNIVMNALDAMNGAVCKQLLISTRTIDHGQVRVSVADTGTGIDPEQMEKVFDPFFSTKPHGMGMGLSISRSIIQSHGGRLWVTANDGPGVTTQFTIPQHREDENLD
jgi:C4-dicarboxylate-specific signal transduction histidine kinase